MNMRTRVAIDTKAPDIDLEKRILRNVVAMTDRLASDGAIVLLPGLDTAEHYEGNPIVQAKHGRAAGTSAKADVIGRAIEMVRTEHELIFTVQFADTELGRDYSYLYGVNPEREVYMRAWSGGFTVLAADLLAAETAMAQYPAQWDKSVFESLPQYARQQVEIVRRATLTEFSAVGRGADKAALTRALRDGCRAAGDVLAGQDIDDLQAMLTRALGAAESASLVREIDSIRRRVQALEGKGASAALQRDSDELRRAIEELTQIVRGMRT